jgi:hypothetical protein
VKYAYQEWPHPENVASSHSQNVKNKGEHDCIIMSNFKMKKQTINENENPRVTA